MSGQISSADFARLVNYRQDVVYIHGISPSDERIRSIDQQLHNMAPSVILRTRVSDKLMGLLTGVNKEELRWRRFYQKPQIIRSVLEKLNRVLGYRGTWIETT